MRDAWRWAPFGVAALATASCREPPAPERARTTAAPVVAATSAPLAESQPPARSGDAGVDGGGAETGSDAGTRGDGGADAGAAPDGMVVIPAGMFMMGSPVERGLPEERPMHEVIVAAFDLDRTEIRTRDYLACFAAGACTRPHEDSQQCNTSREAPPDRGEHPINCIDARQAEAYCAFVGKRLPTEREWEYAARGGAEERRYSWGEDDPTTTNACYFHLGSCPVGSFAPGAFGLYDMSGNVWEWTSTWFGAYPDEATTGTHRIYRGGSWSRRFPKWLTTTMRNRYEPDKWTASLGARCARTRLPLVCPEDSEAKGSACVRSRGTPRCEPTFAWNGEMCTFNGGPSPKRGFDPPPGPSLEDEPVTKTRTPQNDADCAAHYAGTPAAYRFSGATFHARNVPINGGGCVRRDMGQTWTSACCPQ